MNASLHPSVVVGVDGSSRSRTAVDFAADEAARRRVPLRVVHVYQPAVVFGPAVASGYDPTVSLRYARTVARDEAGRIAATHPDLQVTPVTVVGDPGTTLIGESEHAALVVVGSRGSGTFPSLLLGSVAARVAAHATAPVVVVRGAEPLAGKGILVGVDGSRGSDAALGLGFEEAALRGTDLTAAYAWAVLPLGNLGPVEAYDHPEQAQPAAERMLAEALAGWQEKYPQIRVHRHAVHAVDALQTLVEEAAGAQLVVVGPRGHGVFARLLLGSITDGLIRHCPVPVAVAHPGR